MDKELTIYRVRVVAYFACAGSLGTLLLILFLWFVFWLSGNACLLIVFPLAVVACGGGVVFSVVWVKALQYYLTDKALLVNKGVLFKSRKAIPLDKITDLELVQGPLLRVFNMWIIKVQTAGTGSQMPVAMLIGVKDSEKVREEILAAKTAYIKN